MCNDSSLGFSFTFPNYTCFKDSKVHFLRLPEYKRWLLCFKSCVEPFKSQTLEMFQMSPFGVPLVGALYVLSNTGIPGNRPAIGGLKVMILSS